MQFEEHQLSRLEGALKLAVGDGRQKFTSSSRATLDAYAGLNQS